MVTSLVLSGLILTKPDKLGGKPATFSIPGKPCPIYTLPSCKSGFFMQFALVANIKSISMNLSKDQEKAIQDIVTNKRRSLFFLTGQAGTGKSFIINHLPGKKKMVAPTGVAAQLIGGTTVHRFLGLRPGFNYASPAKFTERTAGFDYLIVDEISMVGYKLFEQFMNAYRASGWEGKVVFVGDFMQLPPVKDEFCFKHSYWKDVKMLQLTTVHRQDNLRFLTVLNHLRHGRYTRAVDRFIYRRTVKEKEVKGAVKLASLRKTVDEINTRHLNKLIKKGNTLYEIESTLNIASKNYTRDMALQELERNGRFVRNLRICKGARVVMLTNSDNWCNGTTGVVETVAEHHIEMRDNKGYLHTVVAGSEEIKDGKDNLILTHTQFPMMLAFALTIHKSQGMTLDKVHIDLDNHFSPGQTYVSISRCTSPSGVTFSGELKYLSPVENVPHD